MTDEEKELLEKREDGIKLMLDTVGSRFYYEPLPIEVLARCGRCLGPASFTERMTRDREYHRPLCTQCRDKYVYQLFQRFRRRNNPDSSVYLITSDQARERSRSRVVRLQPSNPDRPQA